MKVYQIYGKFPVLMFFLSLFLFSGCEETHKSETTANKKDVSDIIISMERAALDRWSNGDPNGFLDISAPDVTYFDPTLEKRLDGKEALSFQYVPMRGQVQIDRYAMIDPKVQVSGDSAVLTFNFVSRRNEEISYWNCTEVYRRINGKWQIIHTHWSITEPSIGIKL